MQLVFVVLTVVYVVRMVISHQPEHPTMILAKLSLAALIRLEARAVARINVLSEGNRNRARSRFYKVWAEMDARAIDPKIAHWLIATFKEMSETNHLGRCGMLNERFSQVVRWGSYFDGGCWVRVADGV